MIFFGRLRGSVMTLLIGTVLSQLIMFAASPLLTRLYEPAIFGQYALLSVALSLVIVFVTGKYDIAVLLPKSDNDGWAIVCLAGGITILVTVIMASILLILLFMFGAYRISGLGFHTQSGWIGLIVLGCAMVFLSGWQAALFVWMNRLGHYRSIALSRVTQASVMVCSQIYLSFLLEGLQGLLLGTVLGLFACLIVQLLVVVRERSSLLPKLSDIKRVACEHSNLPLHTIPTDLIGALLAQFPVYYLGIRFSETAVGHYSLAQRTLLAPMQLISNSVGEVFRRHASATYAQNGECYLYFRRTVVILAIIASAVAVVTIFFASDLFALVFGESWRMAGEYSRIMVLMFALKFVVSPVSFMFLIVKRTRLAFLIHCLFLLLLTASFGIADSFVTTVPQALWLFVLVYSCMYIVYFLFSRHFSKVRV